MGSAIQLLNNWGQGPWECCPSDYNVQRLPLTRSLKGFFLRFEPTVWWTSINRYHGQVKIFSPFLEHSRRMISAFKTFLQHFAIGSDAASCPDYEEYEFVELLSEENQIINLFTQCKLQPHKLSQY